MKEDASIGSQFCQVQGVRGAGEWDLGWGWHMATKLMGEAFEPGDPRRNATLLYFRRSTDEPITPENTNQPYGESPVSTAMVPTSTRRPTRTRHCAASTAVWVSG